MSEGGWPVWGGDLCVEGQCMEGVVWRSWRGYCGGPVYGGGSVEVSQRMEGGQCVGPGYRGQCVEGQKDLDGQRVEEFSVQKQSPPGVL
eukprot:gene15788-biopygen4398